MKNPPGDGGKLALTRLPGPFPAAARLCVEGAVVAAAKRPSALIRRLNCDEAVHSQAAILAELRRVILEGGVPPGTPIPVDQVAEAFGVSRIPVRESLRTLIGEGLVDHQPHSGYHVAQLIAEEFQGLYTVRGVLERAALASAVGLATPADDEVAGFCRAAGSDSGKRGAAMTEAAGTAGRHRVPPATPTPAEFNAAAPEWVAALLGACLDIPEWVAEVAGARPFADVQALRAAGAAASAGIGWDQVSGALNRHPRIGERQAVVPGTAAESAWSSNEQGGVRDHQADALVAGNRAYEQRFGHIFLICAAGLSGERILENLHGRLGNEVTTERDTVVGELSKIAALRLARAVAA